MSDEPNFQQPDSPSESLNANRFETSQSPWKLPTEQAIFLLLFTLTVCLVIFMRLFQLDTLQNEVYGDIDIVMGYMQEIFAMHWPTNFILSAGPLYHYLITPIILLTGQNYAGMKLASAIVSLAGLAATYAFSRRLVNDYFAVLVLFVAGVSSWLLIFSRLGNSQIALPLLTMLNLWLVVRIVQFGRQRDVVICALVSTFGLFIYPQSFIQPGVIFVTLLCLGWTGQSLPKKWMLYFILACIPGAILFGYIFAADPGNFNSYIGNKFHPGAGSNALLTLAGNIVNAALALHVRGDEGFRSNPINLPHLDWLSGILFVIGILFWTTSKENRRWIPVWLVPLILLQIPSILVINQPNEVPSASRTLGVAPIVYMLVASGIWGLVYALRMNAKRWQIITLIGLLSAILFLNAQRYFQTYITNLPYNNTPIGHIVGSYANLLPNNTQVYMVGCCWVDSVPDNFVKYEMTYPENMHYTEPASLSCSQLQSLPLPAVFIWNFQDEVPAPQLELCKEWLIPQRYTYENRPIFNAAALHPGKLNQTIQLDELVHGEVLLNGETVKVDYSPIDMGSLGDLFDGNTDSLIRGNNVNPMVVTLHFSPSRKVDTLDLTLGSMQHFQVALTIVYADNMAKNVQRDYENLPDDPHISITLPEANQQIISLQISIKDYVENAEHIHVRELELH